jgi:predicted CXXCH cytochrome family protein
VTNAYLLQGTDQSSTCLICHGGEGPGSADDQGVRFTVFDADDDEPSNRTPGGDFGWLRLGFDASPAERHGHNVVALDFSLTADALDTAPGGTWTAGPGRRAFACTSCHDPHGRYRMQMPTAGSGTTNGVDFVGPGANGLLPSHALPIAASGSYGSVPTGNYAVGTYRLLAGQLYAPAGNASSPFSNDPPVAVAPGDYNSSEATNEVRVAYGAGMSEWCQNCHMNIHLDSYTTGVAGLRHPAGSTAFLHAGQINVYNTYIASGKVDTTLSSRYTSLVPFEQGSDLPIATLALNTDPTDAIPAAATSSVMCLSCHRAHATAFDSMVRWDQNATFLTDGTDYTPGLNTDRTTAQTQAGYYDRGVDANPTGTELGVYQRSLCNKCHGKD